MPIKHNNMTSKACKNNQKEKEGVKRPFATTQPLTGSVSLVKKHFSFLVWVIFTGKNQPPKKQVLVIFTGKKTNQKTKNTPKKQPFNHWGSKTTFGPSDIRLALLLWQRHASAFDAWSPDAVWRLCQRKQKHKHPEIKQLVSFQRILQASFSGTDSNNRRKEQ